MNDSIDIRAIGMFPRLNGWGLIEAALSGLVSQVAEFEGRHNDRPRDTLSQMTAIVQGTVGKHLPYADLTGPKFQMQGVMF